MEFMGKPLSTLTLNEWSELEEGRRMGLEIRVASSSGLKTRSDIETRVLEFVHINSLAGNPVKLGSIARRFNKAARDCGTSMAEVMEFLSNMNALHSRQIGQGKAYASKAALDEIHKSIHNLNAHEVSESTQFIAFQRADSAFWSRAF